MLYGKDCAACVYFGACEDRANDPAIKDCCVPERPLRRKQRAAQNVSEYAFVTHSYVAEVKAQSIYWRSLM